MRPIAIGRPPKKASNGPIPRYILPAILPKSRPPAWLTVALALSLLVKFPIVLQAAAAIVQSASNEACGTPCTATFGANVTTGNAVIVRALCVNNCAFDVITASDGVNGAYTSHIALMSGSGNTTAAILSKRNATGGFTNVTITSTGGSGQAVYAYLAEVSGLSTAGTVLTGSNTETTVTSHNCSSAGLTGSGYSTCVSVNNSNPTNTVGTGWTLRSTATGVFGFAQDRVTSLSSNQGPWTSSATISTIQVMAMLPEAAAAAGGCRAALSLLGVGGC